MFITIAAAMLSTATPVAVETPSPAPAAAPRVDAAKANPRVCLVDRVTGSMIPMRVCKSLSDWRSQGVDPLAKH